MMPISRTIKARIDYSKKSHNDFAQFVEKIYKNLLGNRFFPNPPIALAVLRAKLDEYNALIVAAMDKSRTAILKRNSVREELSQMTMQLAHYVEAASNEDPAIFDTSGCERIPTHRAPPLPLEAPRFLKIAHSVNSGGVDVTLPPARRKVKHYEVELGAQDSDTPPTYSRVETFPSPNGPVTISGLQPGTRYAFRVRAYGVLGYTDWSDPVFFICT